MGTMRPEFRDSSNFNKDKETSIDAQSFLKIGNFACLEPNHLEESFADNGLIVMPTLQRLLLWKFNQFSLENEGFVKIFDLSFRLNEGIFIVTQSLINPLPVHGTTPRVLMLNHF